MAKKDDWVVTVKDEMERMDSIQTVEKQHWDKRSIYKVPAFVRDLNLKAYKPQSVSFGPYHHGEHHLAPMEKHKHRPLLHFLKRSNKPLESYIRSLAEVAQILKDSYESLDLAWESDTERFLRMMIVDGCFMIEVLHNFTNTRNDCADNDPIFSNHGKLLIVPYIRRDMLMLENQLPMLLLTTLLDEETKVYHLLISNSKDMRTEAGHTEIVLTASVGRLRPPDGRSKPSKIYTKKMGA
ncbi:hypothetical protein RHMOL_Rhmol12G0137900 [Rhododendron molle]|uniref:Uncharacterized protein n=1 Tax=Rhododendron molle TaxID=49168 RepID=A0ACC0LI12_RHOML|nr:hypothetical protein RHMOL_Rhmol12G0137900 [Rhododendron molle]